jgi:hypothetical protein
MDKLNTLLQQIDKDLDDELSRAEAKLAGFSQPDDLKAVYIQAFERNVRKPGRIFKGLVPLFSELNAKLSEIHGFITSNPNLFEIRGNQILAKDQATLAKLNAYQAELMVILQKLNAYQAEIKN